MCLLEATYLKLFFAEERQMPEFETNLHDNQ